MELEFLEDRTLLAVLPAATVTNQQPLPSPVSPLIDAQVAINPTNPQKLVAVASYNPATPDPITNIPGLRIWYSINGGTTWSPNPLIVNNLLDPTDFSSPQIPFARNEHPSLAFDTLHNFYIVSAQHNVANTSGAIVLVKYNFSGNAPTLVDLDPSTPGINPYVFYRWFNDDPAFNPVVAIDTNVPSFTDPQTGAVQQDSLANTLPDRSGNPQPKAIYVAWNTLFTQPQATPQPPPLSRIWVAASDDGGFNFTTLQYVSGGLPAAAPQIAFTQGSADGRVPGGRLLFFWSGSSTTFPNPVVFDRIVMDSSAPDGGVPTAPAAAAQVFTGAGGTILDATVPGMPPPNNTPRFNPFSINVNITDPNFGTLNDLDVTVNLRHPNLSQLSITLTSPGGQTITLLRNALNPVDNSTIMNQGVTGANLGVLIGGTNNAVTHPVGTVFNDQAARSIRDGGASAPFIGHFRTETNSLSVFNGLTAAQLNGTWTLTIIDNINDGTTPPVQFLDSWSLNFTSRISTTGFGPDQTLPATYTDPANNNRPKTTVNGSATNVYPLVNAASGTPGVGPGISVAVDNTLGSFSPHQGTIYVAYTGYRSASVFQNTPNDTDVFLMKSTNGGASWTDGMGFPGFQTRLNDDSPADFFSEGNRPQFMPRLAVDPVTGTLVATWYDGRYDPAQARMANFLATSIDGGATFSPQVFLNEPKTAIDAITRQTIIIEPVPGNQSQAGALGFGDYQGLVAYGGRAYAAFASNRNEAGTRIFIPIATFAAGPRIIAGDMGPITGTFVAATSILDPGFGYTVGDLLTFSGGVGTAAQLRVAAVDSAGGILRVEQLTPGSYTTLPSTTVTGGTGLFAAINYVPYNNTFTSDGTRRFTGFVVQFDRPVDPATFTGDDITLQYRDTVTPTSSPANLTLSGAANFTITPLDLSASWGPNPIAGMASRFLVNLSTPLSGVGTYSYAIGPAINDRIRQRGTMAGGGSGAIFTASGPNINLRVPPSGTGGTLGGVVWPTPPANNADTTTSAITVSGLTTPITDINVAVRVTHTFNADLSMRLVAPNGTTVLLTTLHGGGGSDGYANTIFDDQAFIPIASDPPPPFTQVQPEESLSILNGMPPAVANGTWYLQVNDQFGLDIGTLLGWSLIVNGGPAVLNAGNLMDQNHNAITTEIPTDIFAVPTPVNGAPFELPYDQDTLPLIIPGPHVVRTSVPNNPPTPDNLVLNGTNNAVDITFDRDIVPTSFTTANILRVVGPVGPITTYTASMPATPIPDGGTLNATLTVTDSLVVNDLAVRVNLSHAQVSDLTVLLVAPDGTLVQLLDGGTGANLTDTIFDGYAATSVVAGTGPYSGIFRPAAGVVTATIVSGGSGYAVGDILTVQGGTFATPAQLRVTMVGAGGAITAVAVVRPGGYAVGPTNPVSVTGGTGTGATFTLTFGPGLSAFNRKNYQGTWTLRIIDNVANGIAGTLNGWSLNPFTVTPNPPGGTPNRTFRITIPTQSLSGTYSIVLGPDAQGNYIRDVNGNRADTNFNAGVDLLRGGDPNNRTLLPVTFTSGTVNLPLPAGQTVDARINVPQSFLVQGVTVQLTIQHQHIPDLEATLIAPDGTAVKLFTNVGNTGSVPHANFTGTVFDDAANFPIQLAPTQPGIGIGPGPFNPQLPLSTFKNHGSQGNWVLSIKSNSSTLNGTLVSWNLTLKNSIPGSGLGEQLIDQIVTGFRIFTQDPTNPVSQQSWTAVGPAPITPQTPEDFFTGTGRIGGLALDPSDPSGNTVYVSGASGGVWKTTNFLTTDPNGPTWIPLTDFGPGFSLNTGSIAVFGRNNDPNQSIIFVATGEGDSLAPPGLGQLTGGTPGVGFLRSTDGGRTWRVLDSTVNADAQGNILPINSPLRDRRFVGTRGFKVIVDPKPQANGEVIVYAAISGTNGGLYRSNDTGKTWTLIRAGQATDVVLAAGSADASGNLQILYAAFAGEGVFYTTSAPTATSLSIRNGGQGAPVRRDVDPRPSGPDVAIPVVIPASVTNPSPSGANGRIVLAVPALTGNPLQDTLYQGWLYAAVVGTNNALIGLYQTKDYGLNWTRVRIPVRIPAGGTAANQIGTNDDRGPNSTTGDYNVLGTQGNYNISLAVDPNNPNVVYIGGQGSPTNPYRFIRVDTTTISDAHALVAYDNNNNDGGLTQFATTGNVSVKTGGTSVWTGRALGPGQPYGLLIANDPITPPRSSIFNMLRDPDNPFVTPASLQFTNVAQFNNDGSNTRWRGYGDAAVVGPDLALGFGGNDHHELVVFRDPLTGHTRLIAGNDHGVWTSVDRGDGTLHRGIGTAPAVFGSRNGNLQITQFYYGAAQPSVLAADIAGALFYGNSQDTGFPRSDPGVLDNGNLDWFHSARGDGGGVATDQTGRGTVYFEKWPCCGATPLRSDFFLVEGEEPGFPQVSRVTGLLQPGDDPVVEAGQWRSGTINFAVNPIDPSAIVISSFAGRIFRTHGPTTGYGKQWFPIADPTDLDGTQSLAMAFGAPAPGSNILNDFIYVGTLGGRIFVTFVGGGVGGGPTVWRDISAGLSGGAVQAIVTNPSRGSREAYAVTSGGVFWMADSAAPGATWVNITGNLFSTALGRPLYNDPAEVTATLRPGTLKALQADWRYAIPDDLNNPTGPKHPVLYVGGEGGVFRSLDKGVTWTWFPNVAIDGARQDGGFLPSADVRDLDLVLGNINPANGRPFEPFGRNMLVATTYGRGTWVIRLNDSIRLANGDPLSKYAVTPVSGPHVVSVSQVGTGSTVTGIQVTFSGPVDPVTFTTADVLSVTGPTGAPVMVAQVIDPTPGPGNRPYNDFQIIFTTPQPAGLYRVTLGPVISDYAGYQLDQDQDFINGEATDDAYSARFLIQPGTNSAPVLTTTSVTFPSIPEDITPSANNGTSLPAFLGSIITDADDPKFAPNLAPRGIAVTGVDNTNGVWQYSTDGGTTWLDFGSPSPTAARLLESVSTNRIRFQPNANFSGTATFTFRAWDLTSGLTSTGSDGGTADTTTNGGTTAFSTAVATATITVTLLNEPPSFTKGPDQTVLEDAGPQTVPNWATNILPYPPPPAAPELDEAGQSLTFLVSNDNPALFAVPPAIAANGTLTFTPAPNANGSATVTVRLRDDGGTANGGNDTSAPQTFTITVTPVNDTPSFTKGPDVTVQRNAPAQTVPGWATNISAGPADESGQTLTFQITGNTNPSLFAVPPAVSPSGTLTFTPAANTSGSADITVVLRDNGGTANGGQDTSAPQTFRINVIPGNTVTTITSAVNPSGFGQAVTFTAVVTVVPPSVGTPTGTVTFLIDGTPRTPDSPLSGVQATFTIADLSVGTHQVEARYNGDANFTASTSTPLTQTVEEADTITTVTSSAPGNSSSPGQAVTFTATVTSAEVPGLGTPTGTVNFFVDGVLRAADVPLANGTASFTASDLTRGRHSITAQYNDNGDPNFKSSPVSAALIHSVRTETGTVLSSNRPGVAAVFGEAVITATINPLFASPLTPTGTVTFTITNAAAQKTLVVPLVNGTADLPATALDVGVNTITATYSGDADFEPSPPSASLSQTVIPADSAVTLAASANPSFLGQTVTFTATVAAVPPGSGTPTGTVNFFVDGVLRAANVSLANGTASFTAGDLTIGNHTIRAVYNGSSNFNGSTSADFSQRVDPNPLVFTALPTRVMSGSAFAVTVEVRDSSGNRVTSFNGPVLLSLQAGPVGGRLGGTLLVNAVAGVARFTGVTLDRAGDYTLQASTPSIASFSVAPTPITVTANHLAVTILPADRVRIRRPFSIRLRALDVTGNVDANFTGQVVLTLVQRPRRGGVIGPLTVDMVQGTAELTGLRLRRTGIYLFQANVGGLVQLIQVLGRSRRV
ncbi:MAG TPA: Ig-like domain repeat protein [Gemmataceae bacterium]|nr:Ig-like domain repeat protein [Gemmataceae bacterium]